MKKFLAIILCGLMITMLMGTVAFAAEGDEAQIGSDTYATLEDAVAAAVDGDVITLLSDVETGNDAAHCIKIEGKSITIDLNGFSISQTITDGGLSVAAIAIRSGAELTVKDSVGGGKISATKTAIQLTGTLNLESGTIACDVEPTQADIEASFAYPVWVYAPKTTDTPVFNMTGGSLELGDTQEGFEYAYCISFDEDWTAPEQYASITIKISDGVVEGSFAMDSAADIEISGGTFSVEVPEEYCADTYSPVDNGDGTYTVCNHENTEVVDDKEATCTEEGYTGDTVCSDCGAVVEEGEVIEVDPENHTFVDGVCACGEEEEVETTPEATPEATPEVTPDNATPEATPEATPDDADKNQPETGDNGIVVFAVLAVVALAGVVFAKKNAR